MPCQGLSECRFTDLAAVITKSPDNASRGGRSPVLVPGGLRHCLVGGRRQFSCRRTGGEADFAGPRGADRCGRQAGDEAGQQQPDGNLQVLHHAAAAIASRGDR